MEKENLLYPISTEELERRWALVRADMREHGVDALVIQNSSEHMGGYVKWITDLPATNGYPKSVIFPAAGSMTLIEQGPFGAVHVIEPGDYAYRGVGKRLLNPSYCSVHYSRNYNGEQAVTELKAAGCKKIGLVATAAMQYDFCAHIQSTLASSVEFVDFTEYVDRHKARKSAEEVKRIRDTAHMQDKVIAKIAQDIRPGMHDFEVTALAQYIGHTLGSEQGTFNGASTPLGKPSFMHLHRHEQARQMQQGDHLTLLVENNGFGGFYAEIARTFVLGKAPQELKDGYELARLAQQHTVKHLHPGARCKDVFAAHEEFMLAHGLPPERRVYSHGQGYDMVERPLIRDDENMVLEENMCIVVHPGFSTSRFFAVACDNFLVTASGTERLHSTDQKIFEQ